MMKHPLYIVLCLIAVAGIAKPAFEAVLLRMQKQDVHQAWLNAKRAAWNRDVILITLRWIACFLLLPLILYLFSEPETPTRGGSIGVDFGEGVEHALDYALFAIPSLAGVIAGGGLVKGRGEGEVVNDANVRYYVASVFALWVGEIFYLVKNYSPFVFACCGFTVSISGVVANLVTFYKKGQDRKKKIVQRSGVLLERLLSMMWQTKNDP